MAQDAAPEGWLQRVRRGLPFPPGRDSEQFEVIVTSAKQAYHLNLTTAEVFHSRARHVWDQPAWLELPDIVRDRVALILQSG